MSIAFDEDEQALQICTVQREPIARQIESTMVMPGPLADENFKLDDEFAQKIGGLVFSLLAAHQPDLKPFISVTHDPNASESPHDPA
ncbi:hypothetical protein [Paraburkholderia ferrariae]|uniref:hypothetical protein n=1 Tax=Paraburkholderia ferrariae TaxID=386056 RepID=UPI0006936D4C|nr:hypothetical protein [Paraburkholderia ferrariae]